MDTMTAAELMLWRAFDRESPIGDRRGDIQAAQVASAVFRAQGAKIDLSELVLEWGGDGQAPEDAPGQSFLTAMMALAKPAG